MPRPSFVPGPTCTLGEFAAITEADAEALVDSSRARRREERDNDETEDAPQPAAPEAQ